MSEKISSPNPERNNAEVFLVVLPDGSVGRGFATGNIRGVPVRFRDGSSQTEYSIEVQYDTVNLEGEVVMEKMMVPKYQLSEDVQQLLKQRRQDDIGKGGAYDKLEGM